jgi:tetratricopeptide (TPR) repeat protein
MHVVMEVGLEAVRDVGQIIGKVKNLRHEALRLIAEDTRLTELVIEVAATLNAAIKDSAFAEINAVKAATQLPAFIKQLRQHAKTHPSLIKIAELLSVIQRDLTEADPTIGAIQEKAALAKGAVAKDLEKIDSRNKAEAQILNTGKEALSELIVVQGEANGFDTGTLGAIAEDDELRQAINSTLGLVTLKEESAAFEPIGEDDAVEIGAAFGKVVERLTPHTEHHPCVSGILRLFEDLQGALLSEETPDPTDLDRKLNAVKVDIAKHRTTLNNRVLAERGPAADTLLYQELFASAGNRERHAKAVDKLFHLLQKRVSENVLSDVHMEKYAYLGSELMRVKRVSQQSPQEYIGALKEVLGCALAFRKSGFKSSASNKIISALNKIISKSVRALVVAETGRECRVSVADRRIFASLRHFIDALTQAPRRNAFKALVGVFGDAYAMKAMAKDIARWFDVTVLTREETCRDKLAELRKVALKLMADLYRSKGREAADEYERTLREDPWVKEGESFGIEFEELGNALKKVRRQTCREQLAELRKVALEQMADLYRSKGREAADKYERTVREDPWVKEGESLGIQFKTLASDLKRMRRRG